MRQKGLEMSGVTKLDPVGQTVEGRPILRPDQVISKVKGSWVSRQHETDLFNADIIDIFRSLIPDFDENDLVAFEEEMHQHKFHGLEK